MKDKKIIFAGLDFGGKTSIILTLQQKFSSIDNRPTRGVSRSKLSYTKFLGFRFTTWDLGGQKKFRSTYFKKKYRVFTNTEYLFFVIDMQDPKRFDTALDYLKDILKTLGSLKEDPKINILFHKIDPDIQPEKSSEMKKRIKELKKKIEKMKIEYEYEIFQTSIHDRGTLLKAFSRGVMKQEPKANLIKERLKEYAKNTFSSATVLLTQDYLEMASHYSKKEYLEVCEAVAPHFIDAMSKMKKYDIIPNSTTVDLDFISPNGNSSEKDSSDENGKESAVIFLKTIPVSDLNFHILSLSRNKRTIKLSEKHLPILADHLENLLGEMNKIL